MKLWVLGGVTVAVGVAAFFALEMSAERKEAEWTAFFAKWEARGEVFDVAGNLPPARPEAEEFFAHPWIRKIMAGDSAVLFRLEDMAPGDVLAGMRGWIRRTKKGICRRCRAISRTAWGKIAGVSERNWTIWLRR